MTVSPNTVAASGRADMLANGKSRDWINNLLTGEQIWLQPASDGLAADMAEDARYGHQLLDTDGASTAPADQTGTPSWKLGTKSTFLALSLDDPNDLYPAIQEFAATGLLAAQLTTALADQVIVARQNDRSHNLPPPFGDGQSVAQLEIFQGGNSILLTQINCQALQTALNIPGISRPELRADEAETSE